MFTRGITIYNPWDEQRTKRIYIEGKELKVTAESVHDMLGIPIGGTKLTQLDQWPKDDTSYDEWKQQFKKDSIIRLSAIKNVIVSTTQADFNFKLNFLVLFVNTFCESTSMGRCNLFPLSYISRKTGISNIDWCSYVLDCLVRTKNSYIPYSDNSFFVGPSAFLVLFYADNIHSEALTVTRKRPTICYWSSEKIRYRETFEQEKGRFGVGELNEEFVNEQNEGDTDLEDSDSDKDEDHSVEAYESKISKMINSFERMKEKMNSKLNDAMTKFPEKESFRIFKEKMKNMIVEGKTESTKLFNFPINEIGVEGINLTPIMGQKTNDRTENEDKEGNGEEDSDNGASQPEVDYLLDSNEAYNEGMKNDANKNQKEGEIRVKEKDAKRNENQNDEEEKDDHAEETNNHEETIQQTKNQNLLDKVVDNIVDTVLGIGVSSLNSQEDEIWNHPEMKTIFDNIHIGSLMSTGKTNTLAEKEKSEGVHEQGTKVEKTKGDDTGKENSEDRNEGGTKAKNTKDGCEEKQTEIEKGNAEDRGKKKSENQNKKGEKADKTKGNKGGPSKHDLDQPREKKLADAFKSPFKCRITDTKPKLTHQESIVCEWLFKLQGNTSDVVVQIKYGQIAERAVMKSLYANIEIFGEVLDTWSDLLNHQELERDFGNSPYRLFLKVGVSKNLFVKYFKEINHPRANAISKESIKPQRLKMSWRTVKNKVDCGVFAMRHMETYMGQPLSKWKPGLHKESAVQQTTLEKLRQRYAHIMLTSEINMLKAKVLDLAEKYQKVEFKVRIDHAYKAMQTIQKRIKEY
ncbi:unnamed protein product [Lactuca saligna]|uniref:Ubiquitin-like protease family profile domain-containing protein n=1 Tax=Lactuca saligna TaxID=75948 RepID=A0AA35ZXF8_LACSI|nr:unnamed protein product [Lactuca saligna]